MIAALIAAAAVPLACGGASPAAGFAPGQAALAEALAPGRAVELALRPVGEVAFAPALAREAPAGSYGAEVPLLIKAAGTFRLDLGAKAWVDVVRDGVGVAAVDHGHGAECSGIAKAVSFRLEPGRYRVQLSGAPARALTVRVARVMTLTEKK